MTPRRGKNETETTVPERLNAALAGLYVLTHTAFYVFLPVVLLPHSGWWGLLLTVFVLATPFYRALAHESLHGSLFDDYRKNRILIQLRGPVKSDLLPAPKTGS
ncbi:MAG: hypothetical protein RIM72_12015 [Alphaproteobacteria bacterium]